MGYDGSEILERERQAIEEKYQSLRQQELDKEIAKFKFYAKEVYQGTMSVVFVVAPVVFLLYLLSPSPPPPPPAPTKKEGPADVVKTMAFETVRDHLKAPSTASFGLDLRVTEPRPHQWVVSGTVDSQNSFGAMLRSGWILNLESLPECEDYNQYRCWKIQAPTFF